MIHELQKNVSFLSFVFSENMNLICISLYIAVLSIICILCKYSYTTKDFESAESFLKYHHYKSPSSESLHANFQNYLECINKCRQQSCKAVNFNEKSEECQFLFTPGNVVWKTDSWYTLFFYTRTSKFCLRLVVLNFFFHFWGWNVLNLFLFPRLNLAIPQRRISDWVQ